MGRAPCCDKASVKKGPWSPEEDATLKSYMQENGSVGNWITLPQKIGLKRCGKSCRLRWLNYLRPNIKHGGFTEEEDNIICSLYINIGSRWSIIAAQLPGRTDNDIKNYWNTKLKKKLLGKQRRDQRFGQQNLTKSGDSIGESTRMITVADPQLQNSLLHFATEPFHPQPSFHNPMDNYKVPKLDEYPNYYDISSSTSPMIVANNCTAASSLITSNPALNQLMVAGIDSLQGYPVEFEVDDMECGRYAPHLENFAGELSAEGFNNSALITGSTTSPEESSTTSWGDIVSYFLCPPMASQNCTSTTMDAEYRYVGMLHNATTIS